MLMLNYFCNQWNTNKNTNVKFCKENYSNLMLDKTIFVYCKKVKKFMPGYIIRGDDGSKSKGKELDARG